MNYLSLVMFLVWAIFSFSLSLFLTHLVGVWHTFFGYASFLSLFLTCLVGMWHTFFGYASFISFCIAHIPDGNFGERGGHGMIWSFILW